jgi:putative transposase
MIAYIDQHRHRYGVEPICRVLPIAPSTHYDTKLRLPSARALRDEELKAKIHRVHEDNLGVYGARKVWAAAASRGDRGGPLHRRAADACAGPAGCAPRESSQDDHTGCNRASAGRPGRAGVLSGATQPAVGADLTYVATWSALSIVAFIIDAVSRFLVGWQAARSLWTDLALDALEMAIWARRGELEGLVHHSDRSSQYLSIRYTERLAETIIGLYKTELIPRRGPWKGLDQVEYATLEWVDWFNHRRLLEPSGTSHRPSSRPPTIEEGSQPHRQTQEPRPPVNPERFMTPRMPYTDLRPHHGRYGDRPAVLVVH